MGFDRLKVWASLNLILNDAHLSSTKRTILLHQDEQIDLLDVITKSLPSVNRIHDQLLKRIQTEELRHQCEYLINMRKRTVMINAKAWFIVAFTGTEKVKMPSDYYPYIVGGVSGIGLDYIQLNWEGYQAVWEILMKDAS